MQGRPFPASVPYTFDDCPKIPAVQNNNFDTPVDVCLKPSSKSDEAASLNPTSLAQALPVFATESLVNSADNLA